MDGFDTNDAQHWNESGPYARSHFFDISSFNGTIPFQSSTPASHTFGPQRMIETVPYSYGNASASTHPEPPVYGHMRNTLDDRYLSRIGFQPSRMTGASSYVGVDQSYVNEGQVMPQSIMTTNQTSWTFNSYGCTGNFLGQNQLQPYAGQMAGEQLRMVGSTPQREETLFSCRHSDQNIHNLLSSKHVDLLNWLMNRWKLNGTVESQTKLFASSYQDSRGEVIKDTIKYAGNQTTLAWFVKNCCRAIVQLHACSCRFMDEELKKHKMKRDPPPPRKSIEACYDILTSESLKGIWYDDAPEGLCNGNPSVEPSGVGLSLDGPASTERWDRLTNTTSGWMDPGKKSLRIPVASVLLFYNVFI